MAAISETRHAKNVANFQNLISFCTRYGTNYNLIKAIIKLTALNTLFTNAKNSLIALASAVTAFNNAVNTRFGKFCNHFSKLLPHFRKLAQQSSIIPFAKRKLL